MPFLKLRITLDTDASGSVTRGRVHQLLKCLIRDKQLSDYTCGLENLNGYGEPVPAHFHFHFNLPNFDLLNPKRCIVDYCRKMSLRLDFELKGSRRWAVQLVEEPDDHDRFFRYPLKIQPYPSLCNYSGDVVVGGSTMWLEENKPLAQDEQQRRVIANCLQREKLRDKATFKSKLFDHLDSVSNPSCWNDQKIIWIAIADYYQKEGKPLNFLTISGYTTLYQLHIKQITLSDAYNMRLNPQ